MLKNLFKKKEKKSDTSIGTMNIDSKIAGLKRVDTGGSVLIDTAEELERQEVEATTRTNEKGEEVVELSTKGDSIGSSLPDTTNVNPDSPHAKKFFTEEELSEIRKHENRFREEELESAKKVQMALDSPEYPDTREELWTELCKQEEKFGRSLDEEKELTEAEKDRKLVESMRERGYDAEYSHPENKSISEMNGKELREILNGSEPEEEELSQAEEAPEEEIEIEELAPEVRESASEAFKNRSKSYWQDFASDLSHDVPNTQVESMSDHKLITTSNDELKDELMEMHQSPDYDTTVRKEGDGTIIAKVPKGEKY